MPDPLIEQYNLSLQSGQAGRDRLADSKLKKASESIQRTGKPYGPTRPAVAAVRFTDIKDPRLAKLPPSSISDQFATLQQQQLQNLAAAAKAQYYAPDNAIPPGTAPTGIVQQFNELKRQQGERWKKIVDELWRLEQAEYNILWQLYQAMVRDEYAQLARPKAKWSAAFDEFTERGLELYFNLRPIYYRANIKEPHKLIMQMVSGVTLAGVEVLQGVHPTFAKILERVDRSIKRSTFPQFGIQPVKYIGCFRPEPLGDRISNHMIGAAIDIDATIKKADRNPHLKGPQLDALNEMLKLRAKTQPAARTSIDRLPAQCVGKRSRYFSARRLAPRAGYPSPPPGRCFHLDQQCKSRCASETRRVRRSDSSESPSHSWVNRVTYYAPTEGVPPVTSSRDRTSGRAFGGRQLGP
jgi:hypothetical protein